MTPLTKAATIIAVIHNVVKGGAAKSPAQARIFLSRIKQAIVTGTTPRQLLQDISDAELEKAGFVTGRELLLAVLEEGLEDTLVTYRRKREGQRKKSAKQAKQIKGTKEIQKEAVCS
jgi:hypothetical protein